MHSMCCICFAGLMLEDCITDITGVKWDVCHTGSCAKQAGIFSLPGNPKHDWMNPCDGRDECNDGYCMWCVGGLEVCRRCNAFEGSTPTDCPSEEMTDEQSDLVYAGKIDFRSGSWIKGCGATMSHLYTDS
jgi:hypothetical protein